MIKNEEFWAMLEQLVYTSEKVIDRPKSTFHPRYSECIYPADYGYIRNTTSMDGDGIDIWIGSEPSRHINAIICVVDAIKRDSEIKILVGCTEEEKEKIYAFHNDTNGMKGIMIRR